MPDATDAGNGASDRAERRVRLDYIQGLRGVAVAAVVLYHATTWAGVEGEARQLSVLGAMGVDLFFVISGFCMTWPLLTRGKVGALDTRPFLVRRWLRIAPPYLVAMAAVIVTSAAMFWWGGPGWWAEPMQSTFGPSAPNVWGNVLTHATFTHGFFQAYVTGIDGAFWSLATEWQFYVLLPLLIPVARRFGLPSTAVLAGAVSAVHVVYVHYFAYGFPTTPLGDHIITFRLAQFAAGMLAAWLVSTGRVSRAWNRGLLPALVLVSAAQQLAPRAVWPFVSAAGFGVLMMAGTIHVEPYLARPRAPVGHVDGEPLVQPVPDPRRRLHAGGRATHPAGAARMGPSGDLRHRRRARVPGRRGLDAPQDRGARRRVVARPSQRPPAGGCGRVGGVARLPRRRVPYATHTGQGGTSG